MVITRGWGEVGAGDIGQRVQICTKGTLFLVT